jgi:hypothetical protein
LPPFFQLKKRAIDLFADDAPLVPLLMPSDAGFLIRKATLRDGEGALGLA